jgi:hypothetical protein
MSFRLSLAISRNEFNHAVLACRSIENCQHSRIIRALGWTNDHVYAETPDWLISRLSQVPIQTALFQSADAERQPPHSNPLPVGARATSGSDRPTEREDTVRFSSPPRGEDGDSTDFGELSRAEHVEVRPVPSPVEGRPGEGGRGDACDARSRRRW